MVKENIVITSENNELIRIREMKIDNVIYIIKSSSKKNAKITKTQITKNLILRKLEFLK